MNQVLHVSRKAVVYLLIVGLVLSCTLYSPEKAYAAYSIRQEINIIDGIVTATGDDSAMVTIDTTKFSGATYYFEVVAKVDSGTLTVALEREGTATQDKTVSVTSTSYSRVRSTSFTPPAGTTNYEINLSGGSNPMVKAARIIVIQSSLTNTQTQVEIGNWETGKTNTTNSALSNPKYWKYNSANMDGSPTAYAEVTYMTGAQQASSTTYASAGTFTYITSPAVSYTVVEAWGSGGGGGGPVTNNGGGGGGGGGYARSTTTPSVGSSHTLVVGAGSAADSTTRNDSTYDTTTVVADGGAGTGGANAGTGGTTNTGQVTFNGGDGGNANTTGDVGAGGGGAAGPNGAGATASDAIANGAGTAGGNGNNGSGGAGGNGGNATQGQDGTANATGGGGGGGGDDGISCSGGSAGNQCKGGAPGGGGGGSETTGGTGANGQIKLTEWYGFVGIALEEDDGSFGSWTFKKQIVSQGTATSAPSLVRSTSFTPTNGRHYRIVASTTHSGFTYDIYNAKIIIDQSSPTKLETQYLLANTGSFGGSTGLKDFDTLFDPAEWSDVSNTYIHEANGVTSGIGDVKLQSDPNGTPADITGSLITDVVEVEQSSSMTMPGASATVDVNVTGTGTLNGSRILVQTTTVTVPDAPTSLSATDAGTGNKINLAWTAPASNGGSAITNYKIYRDTSSNPTTLIDTIGNVTSYEDTSVSNGTLYYYRVKATNAIGDSAYSTESSATPSASSQTKRIIIKGGKKFKIFGGRVLFR